MAQTHAHSRPCTACAPRALVLPLLPAMHLGLAQLYREDARFASSLADFTAASMEALVKTESLQRSELGTWKVRRGWGSALRTAISMKQAVALRSARTCAWLGAACARAARTGWKWPLLRP